VNKVILTGRLGRDPEIRFTKTGKAVCNLSLAVKQREKRGNGYVDSVTWHRVVLWQGLAEDAQALRKGTAIRVEGFEKCRTYEGRDGEKLEVLEVVADKFTALDSAKQPAPVTPGRNASEARSGTASVSDQPDRRNGAHNRSESVPKPYSQPAANGSKAVTGGVPRAQIPGAEWDSV
jgi:single-strand DNA-binding protein